MKFNCSITDDLLPLYLENVCSEDSKAALEEHMRDCPACREKLAKMKEMDFIPQAIKAEPELQLASYAKKVKRHRIRLGILAVLSSVLAACLLSLCFLTVKDMHTQSNPIIHDVEDGVYNLTAGALETTAAEVGEHVLYTNNEQIKVHIPDGAPMDGELLLWNTEYTSGPILYGKIDPAMDSCIFTGLSSSNRYQLTYSGAEETVITISDGRVVSFWSSLENVWSELISLIMAET